MLVGRVFQKRLLVAGSLGEFAGFGVGPCREVGDADYFERVLDLGMFEN